MNRLYRCVLVPSLLWASFSVATIPAAAQDSQITSSNAQNITDSPAVARVSEEERLSKLPPSEGLGDMLSARGRYLLAIRVYEALPQTAIILNKLGIACEHMLMVDRARISFLASLKLDPRYSEPYNNLGTLAHSQGDLREAEKMYRKALKLKPDSASSLQNLGTLYYAQRKFKKGDEAYKRAIAIDPHLMEHTGRGIQTHSLGNSVSEIHYHLAMTYAQAGSPELALKYLQQAINEGFHDRNRLLHDKEFADIRTTPIFLQMVDDLKKD